MTKKKNHPIFLMNEENIENCSMIGVWMASFRVSMKCKNKIKNKIKSIS
jgi:hypothetical protein